MDLIKKTCEALGSCHPHDDEYKLSKFEFLLKRFNFILGYRYLKWLNLATQTSNKCFSSRQPP
jgi:hypothetical protein